MPKPEEPPGKTIDAADTLAGAGTSANQTEPESASQRGCVAAATNDVDWAALLRRVLDVDGLECPRCCGRLRFIATITEEPAIPKILDAVGLPSHPPLPHARAPDPQLALDPVSPWPRGAPPTGPGCGLRVAAATQRCVFRPRSLHRSLLIPS